MDSPITPDEQQKIAAAYKQFQAELKQIAHEHRTTAIELLKQIDEKQVAEIEKEIKSRS